MQEFIKKIDIKGISIQNNIFLGPMAGVTDIAFRHISRKFHPGLTFTEMASSKAMEFGSKKTESLLKLPPEERPSVVQIFGSNKDVIKNTILKLNEVENIDIIDINMGCPAPKLVKNGDGAGLLLDLKNVDEILKEAVKVSKKPVTVKTRKGFDEERVTALEVAKICETNGVSMITVHGRTRQQYYSGVSDNLIIKKVKESVNIPVIGNGDVVDVASAYKLFKETGCDGIMISRGALGNPWIFKSILEGKDYKPSLDEKFSIINEHINLLETLYGGKSANLKLRKHVAWYLKGMNGSTKVKDMVNRAGSIDDVRKILSEYYSFLLSSENPK